MDNPWISMNRPLTTMDSLWNRGGTHFAKLLIRVSASHFPTMKSKATFLNPGNCVNVSSVPDPPLWLRSPLLTRCPKKSAMLSQCNFVCKCHMMQMEGTKWRANLFPMDVDATARRFVADNENDLIWVLPLRNTCRFGVMKTLACTWAFWI